MDRLCLRARIWKRFLNPLHVAKMQKKIKTLLQKEDGRGNFTNKAVGCRNFDSELSNEKHYLSYLAWMLERKKPLKAF